MNTAFKSKTVTISNHNKENNDIVEKYFRLINQILFHNLYIVYNFEHATTW